MKTEIKNILPQVGDIIQGTINKNIVKVLSIPIKENNKYVCKVEVIKLISHISNSNIKGDIMGNFTLSSEEKILFKYVGKKFKIVKGYKYKQTKHQSKKIDFCNSCDLNKNCSRLIKCQLTDNYIYKLQLSKEYCKGCSKKFQRTCKDSHYFRIINNIED